MGSIGSWTGRVTSRIDRLSERQFALLSFLPGGLLVALIVLPPILAVLGMSLFRIELLRDNNTPFVGLLNYERIGADANFLEAVPRTIIFAAGTTLLMVPLALAAALLLNRRFRGVVAAGRRAAAAVGRRAGRDRALLEVHLPGAVRHRDRAHERLRARRWAGRLAGRTGHGDGRGRHRNRVAVGAAAGAAAAGGAQDDPGGAVPRGQDGRRDARGRRSATSRCRASATRCSWSRSSRSSCRSRSSTSCSR